MLFISQQELFPLLSHESRNATLLLLRTQVSFFEKSTLSLAEIILFFLLNVLSLGNNIVAKNNSLFLRTNYEVSAGACFVIFLKYCSIYLDPTVFFSVVTEEEIVD